MAQVEEKNNNNNENGTETEAREEEMKIGPKGAIVICLMTEEAAVAVVEKTVLAEKIGMNLLSKLVPVEVHHQRNENRLQTSRTPFQS